MSPLLASSFLVCLLQLASNVALGGLQTPLQTTDNFIWTGQIAVGSPEQRFTVLFDTGSDEFWLPSHLCSVPACQRRAKFNPNASSTFGDSALVASKYVGRTAKVHYGGDASISGQLGSDVVSVAGGLTIQGQSLILADKMSGTNFERESTFDGILGLAYSQKSKTRSVFQQMIEQKLVEDQIFSVYLRDLEQEQQPGSGAILFGSIDSSRYEGDLHYVPLVSGAEKWRFRLNNITLAASTANANANADEPILELCPWGSCEAIADTGTALIRGNRHLIAQLNARLGAKLNPENKLYYLADCRAAQVAHLPVLTFNMNGKPFSLTPDQYLVKYAGGECISALVGHQQMEYRFWILGTVFLRHYYAVFDHGRRRLGLARLDPAAGTALGGAPPTIPEVTTETGQ